MRRVSNMSLKKHRTASLQSSIQQTEFDSLNIYTCEFAPTYGGIATYCHELANAASRAGIRTTVFAPAQARPFQEEPAGYTLRPETWRSTHHPGSIWKIRQLLVRELAQPLTLHLFAEPGPILALGSLPRLTASQGRSLLVFHGSELQRWKSRLLTGRLGRRAMSAADQMVCVAAPIAESAAAWYPRFTGKLRTVPNALPETFRKEIPSVPPKREQPSAFNLLSVGRFHPRKGFHHLLRALGRLPDRLKQQLRYTIIGGDKSVGYRKSICRQAEACRIRLVCQTNAPREALEQAYHEADAFALTSIAHRSSVEGFGLVYLEAGAHGLPCLAYDTGGVRDAVRHEETGYLAKPGDIDGLAHYLQIWMTHPEQRRKMGAANQKFALSRTWDKVYQEITCT